jgi:phosphoribosylaminoimidazole (AIR) synthetase
LFRWLVEAGEVSAEEAYQVFNMGLGMVLFVEPSDEAAVRASLEAAGERVHRIGTTQAARAAEGGAAEGVVRWVS